MRVLMVTAVLTAILLSSIESEAITLTQLTSGPTTEADPSFSPDGLQIVFFRDDPLTRVREIWIMPSSGGLPTLQLTNQLISPAWPMWSPDGTTIAFCAWSGLMKVPSSGGTPEQLSQFGGRHPTWSPDGSQIAFSDGVEILLMSFAHGGGDPLITSPFSYQLDPSFSPDGSKIAFAAGDPGTYEIYVHSLAEGTSIQLTAMGGTNLEPAWSPDGNWIAFAHLYDADRGIWVIPAVGGTPFCLTCSGYHEGTPNWSPDGRNLVFDRYMSNENDDIWLASNLPFGPTAITQTTWGRVKSMFR